MIIPDFETEKTVAKNFIAAGVDEVGRGPLAGPVVACAVVFKNSDFAVSEELEEKLVWIRDSKKLSEKKREEIFAVIHEYFFVGIGIVSAETIDRINILQATFLAMKGAVADLKRKLPLSSQKNLYLLIDGNQQIPNYTGAQEAVIAGDSTVRSIAAASIIAKVIRDRMCIEYEKNYPEYGFKKHKGYGTKLHLEALKRYGATPLHRKSFRPVQLANPEMVNKKYNRFLKPKK